MTTDGKQALASLDEKKAAIRTVLADLAGAAEAAGLPWVARDVRDTRLPKLDDERFSAVVLGEFNHGKSTFINALLGGPVLPTGITPTTALLAHITHGAQRARHRRHRIGRPQADRRGRARRLADGRRARQGQGQEGRGQDRAGGPVRRRSTTSRSNTRRRCSRTG